MILAGEGLHPSSKGARVRFSGKERSVIDGPFAETKELVAGFWLWKVKSFEEAIEWVKRCPNPFDEECEIEIRPLYEAEDFGEAFTPELREQEAGIRALTLGLEAPRFEQGRELLVAGFNETYTFESRSRIPSQWERFAPHIGKVPGQTGNSAYGVCWNYKPGSGFDYLAGVEVTGTAGLTKDFVHVRLPARRYAVFGHREHVSSIPKTIDTIWTKWVPDSGLHAADAPCYERYTEEFDPHTGLGGMEIWIPIGE
jgi:predicted transcriptional regulator YdeE